MDEEFLKKYNVTINPKVDFLIGLFGGSPIPTKQDAYQPIDLKQINSDGTEEILKDFYIRKPNNTAIQDFRARIQAEAKKQFLSKTIIKKPAVVEVIISVSVSEKRFKLVDVDNLAKTILDSLKNIAFEDDSQVVSLICNKFVHPMKKDGVLIGIIKLTETNRGFQNDITLYSMEPNAELLKQMQPIINRYMKKN